VRVVHVGPHDVSPYLRTAADGSFVAVGVAPGEHDLVALPPGDSAEPRAGPITLRVAAGAGDVEIRLPELDFVSGRVLDETGNMVAKAWVQAVDSRCEQSLSSTVSRADGSFTLSVGRGSTVAILAVSPALPDGTKLRARLEGVAAGARIDVKVERPH
jgi:hypothetical protein